MPHPNHSPARPVLATELREFTPQRTAKHVAAILGRWPQVVRNMAKRYGLPLAIERKRRPRT
jgi:hypothetical protein